MAADAGDLRVSRWLAFPLEGRRTPATWDEGIHRQESVQTVMVLSTDGGITGVGAAYTSHALVEASMQLLDPWVIGATGLDPEGVTETLHQQSYWQGRGGAVTTTISAINIALWDIFGKVCGQSVARLLGGRYRERVLPYASLTFGTPAETRDRLQAVVASGYRAVKLGWHPFGRSTFAADELLVRTARETVGSDVELMVDAGASEAFWPHRLPWARRTAHMLADYAVSWFEEPLIPEDIESYRELRRTSPVRIAAGEVLTRRQSFHALLHPPAVHIVQPDVTKVGGLSEARRIGWAAENSGVDFVPHGWNNAIGLAADIQLCAALPGCDRIEMINSTEYMDVLITRPFQIEEDGTVTIPDEPGLGVELDDQAIAFYSTRVA